MAVFVDQVVTMILFVLAMLNGLMANWVTPGCCTLTPAGANFVNSLAIMLQNLVYFLNQLLIALMV